MKSSRRWITDVRQMKPFRSGISIRMSEEQKQQLMATRLQDGTTALDYVLSWPEDDQPWALAGVLSCIGKGYSLNRLTINWETRDLRYGKSE